MTVCFFGIYDPKYARNRVLMEGLRAHGVQVIECRADPRKHRGFSKYLELFRQFRRLPARPDVIIVAFPGQTLVWLARLLFRQPVLFDAFLSLYDSNVHDRKVHARFGLGIVDWLWDWSSCALAKTVFLDTQQHIDYFVRTFGISPRKFARVWIGADESVFHPRPAAFPDTFTVHFHGTFIPLQGISYILEAAALLKDDAIAFRIAGAGQEFPAMKRKTETLGLRNVEFLGMVPLEKVPEYIASAHVCLGIFGDTEKTARVIPNKVYECMAMGKPVITADTPAVRELEAYGAVPLSLVPAADPVALADAIRMLAKDPAARATLGERARAFFEEHLSARSIVAPLVKTQKRDFTPAPAKATL